ncbi:hypothetical protein CDO25_11290 [Sinorhizobium meliloti]|nr:hypothetical protein CDO25_11290 [Sinorhizobium meliloti]
MGSRQEDAGGEIARDLFADASATFLTDRALLVRLATEKLDHAAEPIKLKGCKWVETGLEASGIHSGGFGRIHPISVPPKRKRPSFPPWRELR